MAEKAGHDDQPDDEDYQPRFVPCPNTELCVDLKLLTREPGRLPMGKMLSGVITRDDYEHYTFLENASKKKTVSGATHTSIWATSSTSTDATTAPSIPPSADHATARTSTSQSSADGQPTSSTSWRAW